MTILNQCLIENWCVKDAVPVDVFVAYRLVTCSSLVKVEAVRCSCVQFQLLHLPSQWLSV